VALGLSARAGRAPLARRSAPRMSAAAGTIAFALAFADA
jgi:hypothetical protein